MNELKVHVERIVRPIVAPTRRKNRMREELLQHLTAACAEATEEGGTDPVGRAIERLGDPGELRAELQNTVPPWERLSSRNVSVIEKAMASPGDTAHFRLATQGGISVALTLLPLFFALAWVIHLREPKTSLMEMAATMVPILAFAAISFTLTTYLFRRIGAHRWTGAHCALPSWVKAGLLSADSVVFLAMFLGMVLACHAPLSMGLRPLTDALLSLAHEPVLFLLAPAGFAMLTYGLSRERRQYEAWGCLEIDS